MQEVSPGAREYCPNGPSVVILGGGFGGLHAARALRHAPVRVTLVDRRNHHLFQPLLWAAVVAASPGFLAWFAWLVVHIYFLMGFRNRLLVMFHWAYSYLTYRRGARLITGLTRPRMLEAPEGERARPSRDPAFRVSGDL